MRLADHNRAWEGGRTGNGTLSARKYPYPYHTSPYSLLDYYAKNIVENKGLQCVYSHTPRLPPFSFISWRLGLQEHKTNRNKLALAAKKAR